MKVGKFPDELKLGKITPIYKKESDELLETIGLYQLCQFLVKSLRKLYIQDFIIILYPKESCMIDNLGLESNTQQAMH